MRAVIRHVTRKSRGGIAVRETVVDEEIVVAGRGNDCQMHLPDPRVLLRHAEFTLRNHEVYVAAPGAVDLRINGNLAQAGRVLVGDKIRIGPYDITVEAPTPPADVALGVELVLPLGDDLERLTTRSAIQMTKIGLSLRAWSWLLAIVVLVGTFGLPLARHTLMPAIKQAQSLRPTLNRYVTVPTAIWSSGEISGAHKFFGDNCETCHEKPFVPVRDQACLTCHQDIPHHADPVRFAFANFADRSCESCHKEHRGNANISLADEQFCTSCHASLSKKTKQSDLRDLSDFGKDHPQFRPTVLTDVALHLTERKQSIGDNPAPREDSGLKFPHAKHLQAEGVRDPNHGTVVLGCSDCHQAEEGGVAMRPIAFERNCHRCHELKFDAFIPDRELIHGKPEALLKQVRDVYGAVALRGGYQEPEAPPLVRRRVGVPLTQEEKQAVTNWAVEKANSTLNGRFGKGLCAECHELLAVNDTTQTAEGDGGDTVAMPWTVVPATVAGLYFPKAYFTHAPHRDVACAGCHPARNSISANDVLMPSISVCKSCHGGESADNRVPSTCMSCHIFHRKNLPPMHVNLPQPGNLATQRSSGGREAP